MPVTTLGGRQIHVNEEGFLTDPSEWNDHWAPHWQPRSASPSPSALEGHPLPPPRLHGEGRNADHPPGLERPAEYR